jgi:hypothetical protein
MNLQIENFFYPEITREVINTCISDVDFLYGNKECIKPHLPQQTQDILFDERNPKWGNHWNILKNTFLQSANKYTGENYNNCKAWVFGCFPQEESKQYDWHMHPNAKLSAVMYLSLPDGCETTEFINEDKTTTFLPHKLGEWFMFKKDHIHRNGYWDYSKMNSNRYCLAASVI